jgi:hypothetical protein
LSASGSWPELAEDFRKLSESECDFHATDFTGKWILSGAPGDNTAQDLLHERFESLAKLAAIKTGVSHRSNARDGWLNLVREECPHLTIYTGVVINRPCLASAETCESLERREIELETIAASDGPYGLRREMYPRPRWLYDHPHEALDDADAELQYWRQHVWNHFRRPVNYFKRIIEERKREGDPARPDCSERLHEAVVGLCYDLAVLRANHDLDAGLTEDTLRATSNDETVLIGEIEKAWLASCEMLELSSAEEVRPDFARPFARVREHLRVLLGKMSAHKSAGDNPGPVIAKEATRMGRPSRPEIEKFVNDSFAVRRDRIIEKYAERLSLLIRLGAQATVEPTCPPESSWRKSACENDPGSGGGMARRNRTLRCTL